MKLIKSILITQNQPEPGKSVFEKIKKANKLKIDYRPFIYVAPVDGKYIRRNRTHILDFSAIVFMSRISVDHFFRVVEELSITLPQDMRYFSINENISHYIQKYINVRKRKLHTSKTGIAGLFKIIRKYKDDNRFLIPCSNVRKNIVSETMNKYEIDFVETEFYQTLSSDLSDLEKVHYDVIIFYSPADIKSLFENFPDFKQNDTLIAGFGPSTQKAISEAGLTTSIPAPTKEAPSMLSAIENYMKNAKIAAKQAAKANK